MNLLSDTLSQGLDELNISEKEFSELLIRLLDYGVLNREESQVEAQLYDRFVQCANLVEDYLKIIHVSVLHDSRFRFVRVFPPASEIPGVADDDNEADSPFQGGFRTKPSQSAIAVILVLRVEYEKALREGKVDQNGGVLIPIEELSITLQNLLKQGLPNTLAERTAVFRQLRQLRLIRYNAESDLSLEQGQDSWIRIEPSIISYVTQSMLDQLYPADESLEQSDSPEPSVANLGADQESSLDASIKDQEGAE